MAKFEVYQSGKNNEFRFSITAPNNQIIGTSQNYKSDNGRDNGVDSVKRNASKAIVKDVKK